MKNKMKRYQGLDALCGIFCIMIVWGIHYDWFLTGGYGMEFPFGKLLYPFQKYGYYGVEFFFLLSGFGMAHGFLETLLERKISFHEYLLQRIRKLYPLMLITLAVTVIGLFLWRMLTGVNYYVSSLL